ncbi:MAG: flippase-like domain-containing protein [Alphaproteobacteria bacterium]|nr:flippase-like domain-containing protein [Alphaproteobacteria bacterium]
MDASTPTSARVTPARMAGAAALLVVAVGLLVWVLRGVDPSELRAAWAAVRIAALPLLLAAFVANHGLRVVRWHVLLGGVQARDSAMACLLGFLAVQVLPLRLGELVRPWAHARTGTPLGRSMAALVVERTLDVTALALLLLWVALAPDLPPLVVGGVDVVVVARRSAGLAAGALVALLLVVAAVGPRAASWPVIGGFAASMGGALRELSGDPRRGLPAVLLTTGTWGSYFAYVTAVLACFPGLPGGARIGTVTATAVIAGTTALPTPGFFGSYEASMVAALRLHGADEVSASAAALFLHVSYLLFVAVCALPGLALLALQGQGSSETTPSADTQPASRGSSSRS